VHFLWISALKDFKRRLADPTAMALWLGIPLLIGGLMSLAMGGRGGVTPRAKLLLVDQDDSLASGFLAGLAEQGGADSMLELERVELEEGQSRMDAGEASGLLIIPEGFGLALLQDTPSELLLLTNPAQRILPGILESGLQMLVDAIFYVQKVLGVELATFAEGPPEGADFFADAVIAAQSVSINNRMEQVGSMLFPPRLKLEVEVLEEQEDAPPPGGLGSLLFPGLLFLTMLFIAQGMSDDLWQEKDSGTLRRAMCTPNGMLSFLAGKLCAGTLLIGSVTFVGLVLGVFVFDFRLAGVLPALLWATFAGTAILPLFLWIQILASNRQAGNVLSSVLLFPMMMVGGGLFPFEAMPGWMATVGSWTPNGLASLQFSALLMGTAEWGPFMTDALAMSAFGVVFFALTLHRASGRFLGA